MKPHSKVGSLGRAASLWRIRCGPSPHGSETTGATLDGCDVRDKITCWIFWGLVGLRIFFCGFWMILIYVDIAHMRKISSVPENIRGKSMMSRKKKINQSIGWQSSNCPTSQGEKLPTQLPWPFGCSEVEWFPWELQSGWENDAQKCEPKNMS